MADRVSTIRFRAEGAQGVTGSFEQISRKILAQQAMLQRAQKVVTQKQAGAAMGITQTGLKEAQDQVVAAERQMNTMIADMDYAATHSRFEVKQRLLDRQLEETLKKVEGNEKAQLAIRKAYAIESAKIMQQMEAEAAKTAGKGGGAGAHGRWQPGAYKTPAFGSMSDRFTAMFSVAGMVGNVTGDMTMARNVGMAASGFLLGSPLFAAINAGAIGISAAIGKVRMENEQADKMADQYNQTLSELSRTWSGLATDLVTYNPFGQKMQVQVVEYEEKIVSLRAELIKLEDDIPNLFGRTGRFESIDKLSAEVNLMTTMAERSKGYRDQEYYRQIADERAMLEQQKRLFDLTPTQKGESRERMLMFSKHENEALRLELDYKQKIRQADAAILATRDAYERKKQAFKQEEDPIQARKRLAELQAAERAYDEAREARNRIEQQQSLRRDQLEEKQRQERTQRNAQNAQKAFEARQKHADNITDQMVRTEQAWIRANKDGYEQRKALRELQFAYELHKAQEHGDEMVGLIRIMHENMAAEEEKANQRKIEGAMAVFDAESALHKFRREMQEWGAMGATPEQQKALKDEMLVGRYNKQIERDRLTLALKRNQITKTDADIQRMMSADIRSQWQNEEGEQVRAKIREAALVRKEIREQEAADEIKALMEKETQRGKMTAGEFEAGKFYSGFVNFAALNQEGQFTEMRMLKLNEQIVEILTRIELAGPLS